MKTEFVSSPHEEVQTFRNWLFKNWKLFDQSVWPCLLNHGINLVDCLIRANSSIYLATDSKVVKEWAKKSYGSRVLTSSLVPIHSANGNQNLDDNSSWIDLRWFRCNGTCRELVCYKCSFLDTHSNIETVVDI